eukprot:TRINITY_DN2264_c0_g2_i10.p1 TRINITY_DN2264_c0_g2~~TRINITY_DN2264_c0_g2_i10.p1  ORF type:complete len:2689 (-),score=511.82 TRINITY_DN2264_c0_g2_i10:173-8239(-)
MTSLRSSCYSTIKQHEYTDFWQFSSGYIGVYVFFAFFSTLILFKSGSVRPRRIMTWIATWSSSPKFFESSAMEIVSFGTGVLAVAPLIALIVWIVATYRYSFSYDGADTALVGNYVNCKTLTATICFMSISLEMLRWGLLTWYFRHWIVHPGTVKVLGFACVLFIVYCFMLTQTVNTNDDILNAVVFLTFSALPLVRVLYNYYDDLAIDLNDFLYRTSGENMLVKGAQWDSFEVRWSFLRYFYHILTSMVLLAGYGVSSLWMDVRPSSPGYVMPYVVIVDMAVLINLHNARCQQFSEVVFSFFAVIGFRVIVVYLGWNDRSATQPGAWELVEPVFFLLLMIVYSKSLADAYWKPGAADDQAAVVEDRYTEWLDAQRTLVVKNRNDPGEGSQGCAHKFAECTRKCLFGLGTFFSLRTNTGEKSSVQKVSDAIQRDMRRLERLSVLEVDYEKEMVGRVIYVIRNWDGTERHSVVPNVRGKFDKFKPVNVGRQVLTAPDLAVTAELLEEIRALRRRAQRAVRWRAFVKYLHMYKLLFLFSFIHTAHALVFWHFRDPLDRDLPFFGQIRNTNFYFEVLMYAAGAGIWTFVYGAFMTYRSSKEDMDAYRIQVREMLLEEARDNIVVPRNLDVNKMRPRPLSWQFGLALHRAATPKEVNQYEGLTEQTGLADDRAKALWVAEQEGRVLLSFEKPQLAGKVATLATLRGYSGLLAEWSHAAKDQQGLGLEVFWSATETLLNADGKVGKSSEDVEATFEKCFLEATREILKTRPHDSNKDGLIQKKASDFMIYQFCRWALQDTVWQAQEAARAAGASQAQEVEAAISAAELSKSFFQSWSAGRELGSHQELCVEAATKAARRCGMLLTAEQKENAKEGAANFLGVDAEIQTRKIVEEEIRWPDWKGIASTKRIVFKFQEKKDQARISSWVSIFLGACLSGFLGAVAHYDDVDGDFAWFANTHSGNLRNLIWSIGAPITLLSFIAVWRSWERNNYFFFSSGHITSLEDLYVQWRVGTMQARDLTNVRMAVGGVIALAGWCIAVAAVYSVAEGFAIALFFVAGSTSLAPFVKAAHHRRAESFSHHLMLNGCIVSVILAAIYWALRDTYVLWIVVGIFYTFVLLALTLVRQDWAGWENNLYLANADKFWIVPMLMFLGSVYKYYTRDNPDVKTQIVAALVGGCALLGLLTVFFFAARRLSGNKHLKSYQFRKDARYLRELSNYFRLNGDGSPEIVPEEDEQQDEDEAIQNRDLGVLINCCRKLSNNWEWVAVYSISIFLVLGSCIAMGLYAESLSDNFDNFQWFYLYATAVLGSCVVLLAGYGLVGQTDTWMYTSVLLLPVFVPAQHSISDCSEHSGGASFDFSKTVNLHNSPFMAIIVAAILAITWGLCSTIFRDTDFMFGTNQLAIGVMTMSFTILFGLAYPLYKKLWLNYQISRNYKYLVQPPTIQSPVELINRVCIEEFEKTDVCKEVAHASLEALESANIPMTFEQVCKLSDTCLRKCYTKEVPANSWPTPRAYLSANLNGKGNTAPIKMRSALTLMFPKDDPEPTYLYTEFIRFFKRYVLQLGTMNWDHHFLVEKREDSIRELRCFRCKSTLADNLSGFEGAEYSATVLDQKISEVMFPTAMSTVALVGRCYDVANLELPPEGSLRRPLFTKLYDDEVHSVRLHKEKMAFEGHFALSVAVAAEVNSQVDQIAFYALQGGAAFSTGDDSRTAEEDFGETADAESELEPPLLDFDDSLAKTIYRTVAIGSEGTGVGKMFLPGRETWGDRVAFSNDYAIHVRKALRGGECILSSVGGGINQMYAALKLLTQYLALPCAPPALNESLHRHTSVGVHLIDEKRWHEIFGRLGPDSASGEQSKLTVIDLFNRVEAMHKAYEQFAVDYDHYAAPLEYCAALVTEYFDEELFVGWFQSGQVRYGKLCDTIAESIGFRVFVENMMRTASNDETVQGFAQERPQKAFTQLFQQVNTMMEGFRNASREIMPMTSTFPKGRARPYWGPAALREAYLRVKAIATYEVIYEMLAGGDDEVSFLELRNWYDRLKAREEARDLEDLSADVEYESWTEPNRFNIFPENLPMKREDFIEMHVKLVLNSTTDSVGALCVTGAKAYREFSLLLDDVVHDFVEEHAHEEGVPLAESAAAFRAALQMTSCAAEMNWLKATVAEVDNAFDGCFSFDNASYLWHFNRAKHAVQEETSDTHFKQFVDSWNSPTTFGQEAFDDPNSMITRILKFGQKEADRCGKCKSCESGGRLHKCRSFKSKLLYENDEHLRALLSLFECHGSENRRLTDLDEQSKKVSGLGLFDMGHKGGFEGELSKVSGSIRSLEQEISGLNRKMSKAPDDAKIELQHKIDVKQRQLPGLEATADELRMKLNAAKGILDSMTKDWVQQPPHRHFRRSFAATYRVARILDMTKTDADKNSTRDRELRKEQEEVNLQLAGVMGNCAEEEAHFKTCKRIVFPKPVKREDSKSTEQFVPVTVKHYYQSTIPDSGLEEGHAKEDHRYEELNFFLLDQMLLLTDRMGITLEQVHDSADEKSAAAVGTDGVVVDMCDLGEPKTPDASPSSPLADATDGSVSFTTLVMRGALKLPLISLEEIPSSGGWPSLKLVGHRIYPSLLRKEVLKQVEYNISTNCAQDHEKICNLLKPKSAVFSDLKVSKIVRAAGLGGIAGNSPRAAPERKTTIQVDRISLLSSARSAP